MEKNRKVEREGGLKMKRDIKKLNNIHLNIYTSCLNDIENFCEGCSNETSGLLLGKLENEKRYIIMEVTDGGKNEKRSWASVTPDKSYFNRRIEEAERKGLIYLGEWHKHPGSLINPSEGDIHSVQTIFGSCPQLPDFIMIIVVQNPQKGYNFFSYYFTPDNFSYNSIEFECIKPSEIRIEPLREEKVGSIDDILMKKHFPTLEETSTRYGRRWEGTLLNIKTIVEKTDFKIKVSLFPIEGSNPLIYELNLMNALFYLIWLIKKYTQILDKFLHFINFYDKVRNYKLFRTVFNWFIRQYKISILSSLKILIKFSKNYNKKLKSVLNYLIEVEKGILNQMDLKKFQKITNQSSDFSPNDDYNHDNKGSISNDNEQWYKTVKGQKYLAKQIRILNYWNLSPEGYHFSIVKSTNNLRFISILDQFKDIKLNLNFPNNYLKEDIYPEVKIRRKTNCYNISSQANNIIHGVSDLSEIFFRIHRYYIEGGDINEY